MKNMQIVQWDHNFDKKGATVALQFGKLTGDSFALDFGFPFTIQSAFAFGAWIPFSLTCLFQPDCSFIKSTTALLEGAESTSCVLRAVHCLSCVLCAINVCLRACMCIHIHTRRHSSQIDHSPSSPLLFYASLLRSTGNNGQQALLHHIGHSIAACAAPANTAHSILAFAAPANLLALDACY